MSAAPISVGHTSTTSAPTTSTREASSRQARSSSSEVMPPGSGVPVPGANAGSSTSTSTLMTTLYADLAKGVEVQDAMRDAQRKVLADPATSHPFFWAPFNLIGNWRLQVEE